MVYENLNSWYLLHACRIPGKVGLVMHTSCVNFRMKDLQHLSVLPFCWLLPDNVYWELRLLQESRIFGERASFILFQAMGISRQDRPWDLEQLYEGCSNRIWPSEVYQGTLLFLFGDLGKQDEFLGHVSGLPGHYILVSSGWSCVDSEAGVYPLEQVKGWSVRKAKPLSGGFPLPAVSEMGNICFSEPDRGVVTGKDLKPTGKYGSYACIYTCSQLPGKYIKIYKRQSPHGSQVGKLRNLNHVARSVKHLNLALPETLLYADGDHVIGYEMRQFYGHPLRDYLSMGWEGHDLVLIFRRMALLLLEIHSMHMIVNDLSFNNIIIGDDDQVYIVDCDSFQIFDFPGGGITEIYRHPEVSAGDFNNSLRDPRHEYFSFAVLLFQCLFYDDPLRQIQDGADNRIMSWDNFRFPLEFGGKDLGDSNQDILRLWRKQPEQVQKMFADEFHFRSDNSIGAWVRTLDLLD